MDFSRYLIELIEIDYQGTTYKYISDKLPIEITNAFYGYKPLIKSVGSLPAEIKDKDTITQRFKATFIDELDYIDKDASTAMASYWRMFVARNKKYKNSIIRYYRQVGNGPIERKFSGVLDNILIAKNGNVTIEAVDLLKAMSKVDYPFLTGLTIDPDDMPSVFPANSNSEMISLNDAIPGDFCKRTDLGGNNFASVLTYDDASGTFNYDGYMAVGVVAFDSQDRPIYADLQSFFFSTALFGWDALSISWTLIDGASYYNIYWCELNSATEGFLDHPGEIYALTNQTSPTVLLAPPVTLLDPPNHLTGGERYYRLKTGGKYFNLADWEFVNDPIFGLDVEGNASILANSGYIKVEEEIISYESITTDSEGATLIGIERGLFSTESPRHSAGAAIYFILAVEDPTNIYQQMVNILGILNLDETYISIKFDEYIALDELDVTCLPIIEQQKLSDIFFDLVNLADSIAFPNEDGEIDIRKHSERPDEYILLTDDANLIFDSIDIDLNEKSRFTQWVLYWNRLQLDKKLDDDDAYYRGNITVDDEYGDVIIDKQHSAWLNAGTDAEVTEAINYANSLLLSRRNRQREAQNILIAELELKDDHILLAQVVKIKTSKVLNANGISIISKYRVIYKEPQQNKIKFKFQRLIQREETYCEDFIGNSYDSSIWVLNKLEGDTSTLVINNERIEGSYGFQITSDPGQVNYAGRNFTPIIVSSNDSDYEVTGKIWKASISGNRSIAIGFWSATNYYALIAVDNVFFDNSVALLIRNGETGSGGSTDFAYSFDCLLNPTVERFYKVTYQRSSGEVKFYYSTDGIVWTQLGTTQIIDFADRKFSPGCFFGIFNTTGGTTVYCDDLCITYIPDGA